MDLGSLQKKVAQQLAECPTFSLSKITPPYHTHPPESLPIFRTHTHTMQFIDGGHWSAHCQQMRALCRTIILFFSYISINLLHRLYTVYSNKNPVLSSWSRWSGNYDYLRPGAGAEIIFLINMYCNQFGEC